MKKNVRKSEQKRLFLRMGGGKKLRDLGIFLDHHRIAIATMMLLFMSMGGIASASVDVLWQTVANLIETWVTRLGGVVMFVGGIMFGLGWKNDDADGKTRGIQTIIAGGIVVAVAALTGTFFT